MWPVAASRSRQISRSCWSPRADWYRSSAPLARSFMTMSDSGWGTSGHSSEGARGCPARVAVYPLHGVVGAEGEPAGEQLVERNAEGIQIGAVIDGPVHAARLLGGHVGERAFDEARVLYRLVLDRQARGDAETGELDLAGAGMDEDVLGFDVLVDDVVLVDVSRAWAMTMAIGRKRPSGSGSLLRRSSGSPPKSSRTRAGWSWKDSSAMGWTAAGASSRAMASSWRRRWRSRKGRRTDR